MRVPHEFQTGNSQFYSSQHGAAFYRPAIRHIRLLPVLSEVASVFFLLLPSSLTPHLPSTLASVDAGIYQCSRPAHHILRHIRLNFHKPPLFLLLPLRLPSVTRIFLHHASIHAKILTKGGAMLMHIKIFFKDLSNLLSFSLGLIDRKSVV